MPDAPIDGPKKAAIALLSLDEEIATQVLSKMPENDVRRLIDAVEGLDDVGNDVIASVLEELERGIASPLAMVKSSGTKYVRKLADAAFGQDRVQRMLGTVVPPI